MTNPVRRGNLPGGTRSKTPDAWSGKETTVMRSGTRGCMFSQAAGLTVGRKAKGGRAHDLTREEAGA